MLSQPKMDLALVVDCDQSMSPYLNALKERLADTLKLNRKQTRVALICVGGEELDVDPVFADNVDELMAKIPTYSNSKFDQKEGQPADFVKGMNAAAELEWNKNAQRVLLVIGKNRQVQHGSPALSFDDFVFDTCSLINKIEIEVFVIDIECGLKKLFGQLQVVRVATKDSSSKFNGEWKHVDVAKDTELMGKIEECVCAKQDTTVPTFDDTDDRKNDEPEKPPIKKDMVIRRQYLVLSEPDKSGGVRVFDGSKVCTKSETVLREWNKIVDVSKTKDDKLRDALKRGHGLFEQVAHLTKDTKEKITKMENGLRQELQELLKFGGEIKWYKSSRSCYIPVKLLQQDPFIVVSTSEGTLIAVPPSAIDKLREEPECQNVEDIRSYVREVKMLIAAKCQWPGIKLFNGAQVVMGKTKCTWQTAGLVWGSNDHEGTIYAIEQLSQKYCVLSVKDCSNGKWVELNSRGSNLKILDARGSGLQSKISTLTTQLNDESVRVKDLESQISTLQRDAKTMKQTKRQLDSKISTLQSNIQTEKWKATSLNQKLSASEATKKKQKQQYDQLAWDKRDAERAFEKKLQRKQMDAKEKDCQIGDLRDSCSNATSLRDETVQKYERMLDDYRTLKESSETFEEERKKNQELVNMLRERLVEGSSLLDVSRGFPAVQDIIKDFETVKSQSYQQAAKEMRKVLKSEHKDESKLSISKKVAQLLFGILMKAYDRAQAFEQHKVEEIAKVHGLDENDNGHAQATMQKMMRETFAPIINKVKAAAAIAICQDLKGFPSTVLKNIHRFAEECFCVCWTIILSRDPGLTIQPIHFEPGADIAAIVFNEKHHIEGFGSEDGERLNFVIWPAIIREDTSSPISKMAAVFVNEIPKWNKKRKLKQMENETKEHEKAEMTIPYASGDVETCDMEVEIDTNAIDTNDL